MTEKEHVRKLAHFRPLVRFTGVSLRDLLLSVAPILLITAAAIWALYWFARPAPPHTITITSGPQGSTFMLNAQKYRDILKRNGVTLRILPSEGAPDNLRKLADPRYKVDIGFVQGGVSDGVDIKNLVSLGSVFHEPLALFYRGNTPVNFLSAFAGKRLAIGEPGSGTRMLALALLKYNSIEPGGSTQLLDLGGAEAAQALLDGKIDAAFLMGDSAAPPVMRRLLYTPGIRLVDFTQADGYTRRLPYLEKLDIPMGVFDFGKNVPRDPVYLIGPTVELVARKGLHPALSDLLIEAAREVHGKATLLQRAGEFPAPLEHEFPISSDARRYYTSGKGFLYRWFPFWMATLIDRTLVVFVPIVVLLIPGLKLVPALYSWRIKSRIYRWYGALIGIERDILAHPSRTEREELVRRLDDIEAQVNKMKVPLSYAEQFYVLRDHIKFVSDRYRQSMGGS